MSPTTTSLDPVRRRRETRTLRWLAAALALTTALVIVPLLAASGLVLLLVPFAVFLVVCALVLPLDGFYLHTAKAVARTEQNRRAEADRHTFVRTVPATPTNPAELRERTRAAMVAAAADHGIHFASADLSDTDFLQRFSAGETRAGEFRHGDHLRLAWLTLESMPYEMAEESLAQALRQFLRRISGSNAQFHATHTHGWVRVLASLPERTFADVLRAHPQVLHSTALARYWSEDLLAGDAARHAAVLPDLAPLPPPAPRRVRRYRQGNTSLPPAPYAPVLPSAAAD